MGMADLGKITTLICKNYNNNLLTHCRSAFRRSVHWVPPRCSLVISLGSTSHGFVVRDNEWRWRTWVPQRRRSWATMLSLRLTVVSGNEVWEQWCEWVWVVWEGKVKGEMSLLCIVKEESAWPKQFCSIRG